MPSSMGRELSNRRWSIESVTQHVRASFSAERHAAISIHLRIGPIATVFSLLQSAEFKHFEEYVSCFGYRGYTQYDKPGTSARARCCQETRQRRVTLPFLSSS